MKARSVQESRSRNLRHEGDSNTGQAVAVGNLRRSRHLRRGLVASALASWTTSVFLTELLIESSPFSALWLALLLPCASAASVAITAMFDANASPYIMSGSSALVTVIWPLSCYSEFWSGWVLLLVGVGAWLHVCGVSIAAAVATRHIQSEWRSKRMSRRWHCRACGYPLFGLTGNKCPECGEAFEPQPLSAPPPLAVPATPERGQQERHERRDTAK